MNRLLALPIVAALMLSVAPEAALAKGCIRGAVVGGVGGHFAGHHPYLGAAAGCLIARHHYAMKARMEAKDRDHRSDRDRGYNHH